MPDITPRAVIYLLPVGQLGFGLNLDHGTDIEYRADPKSGAAYVESINPDGSAGGRLTVQDLDDLIGNLQEMRRALR